MNVKCPADAFSMTVRRRALNGKTLSKKVKE